MCLLHLFPLPSWWFVREVGHLHTKGRCCLPSRRDAARRRGAADCHLRSTAPHPTSSDLSPPAPTLTPTTTRHETRRRTQTDNEHVRRQTGESGDHGSAHRPKVPGQLPRHAQTGATRGAAFSWRTTTHDGGRTGTMARAEGSAMTDTPSASPRPPSSWLHLAAVCAQADWGWASARHLMPAVTRTPRRATNSDTDTPRSTHKRGEVALSRVWCGATFARPPGALA